LIFATVSEGFQYRCIVFEGKQDLEGQILRRMRGYRVPQARFIVLRDQDAEDCHAIKSRLNQLCQSAGRPECLVRIACRELESWYLGDLAAVQAGLRVEGLAKLQDKRPYRTPDSVQSPSRQLGRIAHAYQKVGGSRAIGPHLDPENARSNSFAVFIAGIRKLTGEMAIEPPMNTDTH
jgi:hypothetical protein